VPDAHSVTAADAALDIALALSRHDLLLVLISGGGSSLMAAPVDGVTLEQKRDLTRQLLACGATIAEMNAVRKRLSRVKGGWLAAASRAPVVVLAISDVPGDDAAVIASGPAVQDLARLADARAVLARYAVRVPASIRHALEDPANEAPDLAALGIRTRSTIVASGATALAAAAAICRTEGLETVNLGAEVEGRARELAARHAALALREARARRRCCILSGGETTVRLHRSPGRGGRNTEYALALALALDSHPGAWAIAADTDGIDGSGGQAGAVVGPDTLARARSLGIDAGDYLERSDSASFFERAGGLLVTGPTGTNVSDFRAILVDPATETTAC
jgi:hydroxypyruvate reductase